MNKYLEYVENREKEQEVTNFNEVKDLFDKKDYERLLSFCKGTGKEKSDKEKCLGILGYEESFNEYENASPRLKEMIIRYFIKPVVKQVLSEKAFFELTGLTKCPQSGSKVLNKKGKKTEGKAPDFHILYKGYEYYGTQKLINGIGGAQDNQIKDTFISAKETINNGGREFIAIDFRKGATYSHFEKMAITHFGKDIYNKYIKEELLVVRSTDEIIELINKGVIKDIPNE